MTTRGQAPSDPDLDSGAVKSNPPPEETLAAIDIGTNSIHMVIARFTSNRSFETIDREKEMVRLGSGAGDMKKLKSAAMDRGIEALERFRRLADAAEAPVFAVATSAVREAENGAEFIRRAYEEAGVQIEVVSGGEEARLIRLGVLQALPVYDRQHIVVDIGGGSTEIILGHQDQDLFVRSLRLGAVRLTQHFFPNGKVGRGAVSDCRKFVRAALAPVRSDLGDRKPEVAVGSAGTIQALAALSLFERKSNSSRSTLNGYELDRSEVSAITKRLSKLASVEDRRRVDGLDTKRADIIVAGAIILDEIMSELSLENLLISDHGLREGVLLDSYERIHGSTRHHLHDVRRRSVRRLVELCDDDPAHSAEGARTALLLFDALQPWHGLDDAQRERLEAAALLANVGLVISHTQHHRHSYYVIRHSEHLVGFTDHEVEIVALVARYHRKSAPRSKHPEFAQLGKADRQEVRALAAILRVAIGLNRPRSVHVEEIRCEEKDGAIIVEVKGRETDDLSLGLYTAGERRDLLEATLNRPIKFVE